MNWKAGSVLGKRYQIDELLGRKSSRSGPNEIAMFAASDRFDWTVLTFRPPRLMECIASVFLAPIVSQPHVRGNEHRPWLIREQTAERRGSANLEFLDDLAVAPNCELIRFQRRVL